jgi:hypothetical protein
VLSCDGGENQQGRCLETGKGLGERVGNKVAQEDVGSIKMIM